MIGMEEDTKKYKTALLLAGADPKIVKSWMKTYDKTKRNSIAVAGHYYSLREDLNRILNELEEMEQMIIDDSINSSMGKNRFTELIKDFKRFAGKADNEFLISKADKDFHTTLDSIVDLGSKYIADGANKLILQSEVENMISITKEGLDRDKPDMFALTYYYLKRSDKDLAELTFSDKVIEINRVFREEFVEDIMEQMLLAVKTAAHLSDRYEGDLSKKSIKLLENIKPILVEDMDLKSPEDIANEVIRTMCAV